MRTLTRLGVLAASLVATTAVVLVWLDRSHDHGRLTDADISAVASATDAADVAGLRVFFAHQSVGGNIVAGLPGAYRALGVPAPPVVELSDASVAPPAPEGAGGVFAHVFIGENGDPLGKIGDFDARIRAGLGDQVDVAMLKLCYIDLTASTDVDEVLEAYRTSFHALGRDDPEVTFVPVTTPLTTEPALRTRVKGILGGNNPAPADNVARQRFNDLLRAEFGDRVFDVAALESRAPDGSRITGTHHGQTYFALYDGYAVDEGHLDQLTSDVMAARLLRFLAERAR